MREREKEVLLEEESPMGHSTKKKGRDVEAVRREHESKSMKMKMKIKMYVYTKTHNRSKYEYAANKQAKQAKPTK